MADNNRNMQMVRLQKLIDFLSNSRYGYSVEQILQKLVDHGFTCSKRTVYRDIDAMLAMGYPLVEDKTAHKWRIETDVKAGHAFQITPKALIGLYVLKGLASPLMEGPLSQDLAEFFQTIDSKLGEKGQEYLNELAHSVYFSNGIKWGSGVPSDILHTIQAACAEKQILEVEYESNSGKRVRKLGPQNLYFAQGSVYLIAEDLDTKTIKTFALPRFSSAVMLDEEYTAELTSPKTLLQNSFAVFMDKNSSDIELLFDKEMSLFVRERQWHASQKVESKANGELSLKINLAITPDFVSWVMSFGDKVEVISPKTLKEEIEQIALKMIAKADRSKAS